VESSQAARSRHGQWAQQSSGPTWNPCRQLLRTRCLSYASRSGVTAIALFASGPAPHNTPSLPSWAPAQTTTLCDFKKRDLANKSTRHASMESKLPQTLVCLSAPEVLSRRGPLGPHTVESQKCCSRLKSEFFELLSGFVEPRWKSGVNRDTLRLYLVGARPWA
jgi:hypothetical protein